MHFLNMCWTLSVMDLNFQEGAKRSLALIPAIQSCSTHGELSVSLYTTSITYMYIKLFCRKQFSLATP